MKNRFYIFILGILSVLSATARENILLEKWKFYFGELNDAVKKNFNDSEWENVIVPHDWAIDKPFDMRIDMQSVQVLEDGDKAPKMRTGRTGALPAFGIGYYRTSFKSDESMVGKRIRIEFDGAMSLAKVYLNGEYVGEWPYGYSSFAFDITDKWNFNGENIIAVRLENKPESSRWYSGAGLYRNVRLVVTEPVSVGHWGTYITTPNVSARKAGLNIETCVVNKTGNEVKEQYRQVVGQNGIPIYRLYSFSNGRDSNNTFSLCATLRQRFAFCGSARYVSRKRCSSFAESFSSSIHFIIIFVGRIPVSIPHGRLLPVYFSNKRYKNAAYSITAAFVIFIVTDYFLRNCSFFCSFYSYFTF